MTTSASTPLTVLRSLSSEERTPERLASELSRTELLSLLALYAIGGAASTVGAARRSRLSLAEGVLYAYEAGCRSTLRTLRRMSSLPAETFSHSHADAYPSAREHMARPRRRTRFPA